MFLHLAQVTLPDTGVDISAFVTAAIVSLGAIVGTVVGGFFAFRIIAWAIAKIDGPGYEFTPSPYHAKIYQSREAATEAKRNLESQGYTVYHSVSEEFGDTLEYRRV